MQWPCRLPYTCLETKPEKNRRRIKWKRNRLQFALRDTESRVPQWGFRVPVASSQAGAATQASVLISTGYRCASVGFPTSPSPRGWPEGLTMATTPQICVSIVPFTDHVIHQENRSLCLIGWPVVFCHCVCKCLFIKESQVSVYGLPF